MKYRLVLKDEEIKTPQEITDKCDELFDYNLKKFGYTTDDIRFLNYEDLIEFEKALENSFRRNDLNLSFKEGTSKYGMQVAGNAGGMSSAYIMQFTTRQWKSVKMTKDEILKAIKNGAKIYKRGKYFSVEPMSVDKLLATNFGTEFKHHGYGSQSSTSEEGTELRQDKDGNLMVSSYYLVWD